MSSVAASSPSPKSPGPIFARYIGIDYSGAAAPTSRQPGLRVFRAVRGAEPTQVRGRNGWNWTRAELASWLRQELSFAEPTIVGIDHAFSFPESYFGRHALTSWDAFLDDFAQHWPADLKAVEVLRNGNARSGDAGELRLCDRWTSSAKSVFLFDVQGSVAKSTHAGLPWLRQLRQAGSPVHFWPFDGWVPRDGMSVLTEVYPSMFRRRYPRVLGEGDDEHDARSICWWLAERDELGALPAYFTPILTQREAATAAREGWILGVL